MTNYSHLQIVKVAPGIEAVAFDCGDADLNDFLKDDALRYFYERMAVTYMLLSKEQAAAYYCLLNDKITFDTSRKNEISFWNRFNRKNKIPNPKRRQNYPAVKLGRFAVSSHFQGQGIGRLILDGVKANVNPKNRYGVSLFNR